MLSALKLRLSYHKYTATSCSFKSVSSCFLYDLRLPNRRYRFPTVQSLYDSSAPQTSEPSTPSNYIASIGSSQSSLQLSHWNLTHRHIIVLDVIACAAALSATWLFLSAIPAILDFKRAAESLEKLMDATREELPDTMAAIRLSGMEISDLTMELSDLGQEITQGVRTSTRVVRIAEERLRCLTNIAPPRVVTSPKTETSGPALARTARGIREGIVKGRAFLLMFFIITQFSRMAFNYFAKRVKRNEPSVEIMQFSFCR